METNLPPESMYNIYVNGPPGERGFKDIKVSYSVFSIRAEPEAFHSSDGTDT